MRNENDIFHFIFSILKYKKKIKKTWSIQVAASGHGDGEQSLIFVSQFCPVNPKI